MSWHSRRVITGTVIVGTLVLVMLGGCNRPQGVSSGDIPMSSTGGSFVVQCIDNDLTKIIGWQPAPGYDVKVVVQGPSAEASIKFLSASAKDVSVAVRCVDGQPRMEEFIEEDSSITTTMGGV